MTDTLKAERRPNPHPGKSASPWSRGPNCHSRRAREQYRAFELERAEQAKGQGDR